MRIYDSENRRFVEVPDAEPVDHSQNPLIGVLLLVLVLVAAWLLSGSPAIIIVGV